MIYTIHQHEQRSEAWRLARLGRVTGSRAKDVLATIKSGEAAARRDYRTELVCERLTGQFQDDTFISKDIQRGVELEPDAFAAYEALTGHMVRRTGFLAHNMLMVGASLDGDIDSFAGILEVKCPRPANHLKYLRADVLPSEHEAQVTHALWLTGAKWADFVSYSPVFPEHLRLFVKHVERDEKAIADYERKVLAFLEEVEREEAALRGWSVMAGATA